MIVQVVYVLCAVTSLACAGLLVRAWASSRTRLLLWSSVCFVGLFVNNVVLVVDEILTKNGVNLLLVRDATNLVAVAVLAAGLVWSAR